MGKTQTNWSRFRGCHWHAGARSPCPVRRCNGTGSGSSGRKDGFRGTQQHPQHYWQGTEEMQRGSSQRCMAGGWKTVVQAKTWNNQVGDRKHFLQDSPGLERVPQRHCAISVFGCVQDPTEQTGSNWSNLIWIKEQPCLNRRLGWRPPKVLSNQNCFIILQLLTREINDHACLCSSIIPFTKQMFLY